MGHLTIEEEYVASNPRSAQMFQDAHKALVSGITHDARFFRPFPIYVERALGSHKWDVDGHDLIDYVGGHGALIFGHCYPKIVQAIQEQAAKGTQYGACHELEITYSQLVQQLVPSAEKVRFFSSGTEATLMAMRLARAYTGKSKIMVFQCHYHGWHDYGHKGYLMPFDVPSSVGIPEEVLNTVLLAPPNDREAVLRLLDENRDVACIILEPSGGTMGAVPTAAGFLEFLREETRRRGVVLIFDEVVTGFRFAPGGAQEYYGVIPDMTCLGKIVAGGLPGAALGARADIMETFEFRSDAKWNRFQRTHHYGTFNCNPLTAAAGCAALTELSDGVVHRQINEASANLKRELEQTMVANGVPGCCYGDGSLVQIRLGKSCPFSDSCDRIHCRQPATELLARDGSLGRIYAMAMRNHGVDLANRAILSGAHTDADLAETVRAFDRSIKRLKQEGLL